MTRHEKPGSARARCNIELAIDKLSESERQLARDCLRKGELMGEFIGRTSGNLRSIVVALVSGSLTRPVKWNEEGRS